VRVKFLVELDQTGFRLEIVNTKVREGYELGGFGLGLRVSYVGGKCHRLDVKSLMDNVFRSR
jgi:hypothetical protein